MKIVVLIENTAPEGSCLAAEHGLSFYVEHRGKAILLDAGASGAFADNAAALGVGLERVDAAVLSHGHYDHAGGLGRFFACNGRAKVYARPSAGGAYFSTSMGEPRFIGVSRELWEGQRDRFETPEGLFQLFDGVWLVPETVHGGPLPAGRPTCCARWRRGALFRTTSPMSTPWCWRAVGAWCCLTPAPTGGSSTSSAG